MARKPKQQLPTRDDSRGGGMFLSRTVLAMCLTAVCLSMIGYAYVVTPSKPPARSSAPAKPAAAATTASLLMPSVSKGASHQRKWVRQVISHARRATQLPSPASIDVQALVSTPAGNAMQMNIQRHLAKGYDTIPIVVAQDEVKGLSVFYAGPQVLKKDTVVGAWQIFVVREDLVDEWIESGELANTTEVQTFWETYSIEHKYEGEEHRWFSFPVGERPGAKWHAYGALTHQQLAHARDAFNSMTLPDWMNGVVRRDRETGDGQKGSWQYLPYVGHLMNEPSTDEPRTIGPMSGERGCSFVDASSNEGEEVRACGGVLEASTMMDVQPGAELAWCYGGTYKRQYNLGTACSGVSGTSQAKVGDVAEGEETRSEGE